MQCYKYDPFDSSTWDLFDEVTYDDDVVAANPQPPPLPTVQATNTERKTTVVSVEEAQKMVESASSREEKERADAIATRVLEMQEMREIRRAEEEGDEER